MSQSYQVVFYNNSKNQSMGMPGFGPPSMCPCIFQQDAGNPSGAIPVAWQVQNNMSMGMPMGSQPAATFNWNDGDFCFVYGTSNFGSMGYPFQIGQIIAAGLTNNNVLSLNGFNLYTNNYSLSTLSTGSTPGTLTLSTPGVMSNLGACTGIGMAGAATFIVETPTYSTTLTFTPKPTYWIAFGYFAAGASLDPSQVTMKAQLDFPPGVTTLYATLDMNNDFTISATAPPQPAPFGI